ncbi:MAG TPA: CopD family protein [Rhizomicrobium sp.]|nr:CopD family protein [Rhizomicrobium sp.]
MIALFAFSRTLHFASLMSVFGAAALLLQARGLGVDGTGLRKLLGAAAFTALATAVLCLCGAGGEMSGDLTAGFEPQVMGSVIAGTYYGHVFLVRIALLVGVALLSLADGAFLWKALLSGAALAALGLTSHAAASGTPRYELLRAANDSLHLLASAFWVGGLVVLVPEVWRRTPQLVGLLTLFSRWGVASVAVLVIAGTLNGVFILGQEGMPWNGTYVTLLAAKIVLAAAMVALALTNRFGVLPALARGEEEAAETIPLTVSAELGAALAILVIVGFLGLTAPMQM